jgi:desulfoferrodoxin-like iron-binding protein
MQKNESYRCSKCGNVIEVQHVGGGKLVCCGEPMENVTENLTAICLMKAVMGESVARNKYEYYAKVAQNEGHRDIAAHFQRAANNEKTHAKLQFKLRNLMLTGVELGDTMANLVDAISGESYEHTTMYPEFAAIAKAEGHMDAAKLFEGIGKIEIEHEKMYRELLARLENGTEFESDDPEEEWICEECGRIHKGKKPPKVCPVCKHPESFQSRNTDFK